jgi:hypothetical protein
MTSKAMMNNTQEEIKEILVGVLAFVFLFGLSGLMMFGAGY